MGVVDAYDYAYHWHYYLDSGGNRSTAEFVEHRGQAQLFDNGRTSVDFLSNPDFRFNRFSAVNCG
jgi:hypothetical protein